jgi:hypothetical protein
LQRWGDSYQSTALYKKRGGMKSMKKIVMMTLCVMFVVSVMNIQEAGAKDKCYTFYYNWRCLLDDNYDYKSWDYTYYRLKDDGTFDTSHSYYGRWYVWKGSLVLRQINGCQKVASGKKNMGFMNCTDGSNPAANYVPGCWFMKKTKCTMFDSE